jgi:proprotein convertase subtilisin/kexin type 5
LTCSQSAVQCVTCDSTINRVQGYDNLGHQTCVCQTGYYALPDASCVQSNCNADPYCSQCEADLALCVQCRATLNRVLQQGTNRCVCANGYYQDKNNNCSACSVGCAQCNSSTSCTTCVALATNNGDGTCTCASGTFFSVSSNGVRYCQQCPANCNSCSNALTCNVCQTNYVLSASNTCICPVKFFVNPSGNCVPCKIGCDVCTSNTTCTKCTSPLVVQ